MSALPAEAATPVASAQWFSSDSDWGDLSEDGTYGDTDTSDGSDSDANGLANGLESGDVANGLANGLSSGDEANSLANGL